MGVDADTAVIKREGDTVRETRVPGVGKTAAGNFRGPQVWAVCLYVREGGGASSRKELFVVDHAY